MPLAVANAATPQRPDLRQVLALSYWGIVVILNSVLLFFAWREGSWTAAGIAMIYGPMLNGIVSLISLIPMLFLSRYDSGYSHRRHLFLSIGLPATAIVVDYLAVMSMDFRGC